MYFKQLSDVEMIIISLRKITNLEKSAVIRKYRKFKLKKMKTVNMLFVPVTVR